jgi:hypothetical protein
VPTPLDTDRWLSVDYWRATRRLGMRLTRDLAPHRVAHRARKLIEEVLAERPTRPVVVPVSTPGPPQRTVTPPGDPAARYRDAQEFAAAGQFDSTRTILADLDADGTPPPLRALVRNDVAALAAVAGDLTTAAAGFRAALAPHLQYLVPPLDL